MNFLELHIFQRFIKIYQDLSRFVEIYHGFYQDLSRFLLTRSEFFQGFFSFTESLLEHSYQIALIYQHGQLLDEKPGKTSIYVKIRDL